MVEVVGIYVRTYIHTCRLMRLLVRWLTFFAQDDFQPFEHHSGVSNVEPAPPILDICVLFADRLFVRDGNLT